MNNTMNDIEEWQTSTTTDDDSTWDKVSEVNLSAGEWSSNDDDENEYSSADESIEATPVAIQEPLVYTSYFASTGGLGRSDLSPSLSTFKRGLLKRTSSSTRIASLFDDVDDMSSTSNRVIHQLVQNPKRCFGLGLLLFLQLHIQICTPLEGTNRQKSLKVIIPAETFNGINVSILNCRCAFSRQPDGEHSNERVCGVLL
jgi:hypothetical protein